MSKLLAKTIIFPVTIIFTLSLSAGENNTRNHKKCRPGNRRITGEVLIPEEAVNVLCMHITSEDPYSLYYFEKALLKELEKIHKRTGICYFITDPQLYNTIKCNSMGLLHFSALKMNRHFINEFVNQYRIDVNIQDDSGYTIYDYADLATGELLAKLGDKKNISRRKVLKVELDRWNKFKEYLIKEFNARPCRVMNIDKRRVKKCPETGIK